MEKYYSYINRFFESIIAILMAFIVILMFSEVVSRYFLRAPIVWSEEIATYAFIWIVYLGSGVAFYRNIHIRVDYISFKLGKRALRGIEMILNLFMAFFFLFLLLAGIKFALLNFHADSYTLPIIKLGWVYVGVPMGALLMFANVFRNISIIYRRD